MRILLKKLAFTLLTLAIISMSAQQRILSL